MFDLRLLPGECLVKFNRQLPIANWAYPGSRDTERVDDRYLPYNIRARSAPRRRAVYIHVPFCDTICTFCPFPREQYSGQSAVDKYVEALLKEFDLKRRYIGRPHVDALFIGGGTPSLLSESQFGLLGAAIHENFVLAPGTEFTVECEVKSVSRDKLRAMRDIGVTRVSFGVQTLLANYRTLFSLDASETCVKRAADMINETFPYTNADMMYGFAGQSVDQLIHDLTSISDLGTTTIDVYPINNLAVHPRLHHSFARSGLDLLPATARLQYRVAIDQHLRERGCAAISGYCYARANATASDNPVVQHSPKCIYLDMFYGYEDDEIIGYGPSSMSRIAACNIFNFRSRSAYVRELLDNNHLPHWSGGPFMAEERGVVGFPCRGDLDKARIKWANVPEDTLTSLRQAIAADLVIDAGDKYIVTKLGWLFYVNLMYFLMPSQGKSWISDKIEFQRQSGRNHEDTSLLSLVASAAFINRHTSSLIECLNTKQLLH
jgi:anaerobilin synthase